MLRTVACRPPWDPRGIIFEILREEARGKRLADIEACIISLIFQEVCSEPIHHSPDFQQLLWLLQGRQHHPHWELCSAAFQMMEDIWWAYFVTGHLRTLTLGRCISVVFRAPLPYAVLHSMVVLVAFSQLPDAKMLCRSALMLKLSGKACLRYRGKGPVLPAHVWMPLVPLLDYLSMLNAVDLLPSSATCGEYSDSLNALAAGGARERLILSTGSRTGQQVEGIGIFDSTAHGWDSSKWICRTTYVHSTLLAGTAPRMQCIQCSPKWTISVCTGPQDQAFGQAWPQHKEGNQGMQPAQSQGARLDATFGTICYINSFMPGLNRCSIASKVEGKDGPMRHKNASVKLRTILPRSSKIHEED